MFDEQQLPLRAQDAPYRLIVNSNNPVGALSRDEVSKLFLKKVPAWHSGEAVVPVDQSEDAEVRRLFSKRVLGKDVASVKGYWQQAIFTGRGSRSPLRMARSEPPMPTGTMGTPARVAT